MSGIVGLWNRDGRPIDRCVAARMRDTLTHRGDPDALFVSAAGGGVGGTRIAFDGRLDNRDDLVGGVDLPSGSPDAAIVLALYQRFGRDCVARLDGDFALAIFDAARQTMLLARDPIGIRPLYYHATATTLAFASEIKAILAHPDVRRAPDDDVVADYVFNLLAADDEHGVTFYRDVRSVLPSHLVAVTPGRVERRRYWDFDVTRRFEGRSFGDAAAAFRERFERAVKRRLRTSSSGAGGSVAISVSGGLDSTAIFCVADRARHGGHAPRTFGTSYTVADGAPADEKRYLDEIERACQVAIVRWDAFPGGVVDGSGHAVWHADAPLLESRWTGTDAYYRAIRGTGATGLLTGHWGDQLLVNESYLVDLVLRGAWTSAWRHTAALGGRSDDGAGGVRRRMLAAFARNVGPAAVVAAWRRQRARAGVEAHPLASLYAEPFRRRAIAARARRSASAPPGGSAHARAMYRVVRSRYHVLCMEWNNKVAAMHGMDAAFPFLDRDLIALVMSLPGDVVTRNGEPKALLREAMRGLLPEAIRTRTTKADFSYDANREAADDYDKLVECLRGGAAAAFGYVDAAGISLLERSRPHADAATTTLTAALIDLLALQVWLDRFFGSGTEVH
jgi:asparagine synthase (glutamine-hydrolysing)